MVEYQSFMQNRLCNITQAVLHNRLTHSTLCFTPHLCRGCAVLGVAVGVTWVVAAVAVCGASERGAESGWCLLCPETWDVADGLDRNCGVDGAQSGKV